MTTTTPAPAPEAPSSDLAPRRRLRQQVTPPLAVLLGSLATAALAAGRPLVALALGAVLVALLVAEHPSLAAHAAVALVLSNAVVIATTRHGVPGVAAAAVPLLLLVSIGHRVAIRRERIVLPVATPWVAAMLVGQLLGAMAGRDPDAAVGGATTFATEGLVLFVLVALGVRGGRQVRRASLVLVGVATLLSLVSLQQRVTGAEDDDRLGFAQVSDAVVGEDEVAGDPGSRRHAGPLGEQNRWAQTLAVVLPVALALAATDRALSGRLVGIAGTAGIGAGIVLTYSRGAALGLLFAGAVAVACRWVSLRAALACAAVGVAALLVFAPVFVSRATTVVTARDAVTGSSVEDPLDPRAGRDGSFSNRATEAAAAFAVFVHHPVVGVGPGQFPGYFQDEARRMGADRIVGVDREAHNLYLGIAAEGGAVGLVTFVGAVTALLMPLVRVRRRHLRDRRDVAGLAMGWAMALVVYLTTGLFLHFAYIRYFWLFAGMAAAAGLVDARVQADRGGR